MSVVMLCRMSKWTVQIQLGILINLTQDYPIFSRWAQWNHLSSEKQKKGSRRGNQTDAAEGEAVGSKHEENLMHYQWLEDERGHVSGKWILQSYSLKELNSINNLR